jgi:hypothetical protein
MKKLIEDLTSDQEAQLDIYAEKYTELGLSLKPIDHEEAQEAITQCYIGAGIKAPAFEWLRSPFEMLVRGAQLEHVQIAMKDGKSEEDAQKEATKLFDITCTLSNDSQNKIRDLLNNSCYGQHDAGWLGWYDFFQTEVGLEEETDEIKPLIRTVKAVHWWLPFENVCLCSERPVEMYLGETDAQGNRNLHRNGGPAMKYADDFCIYSLNGVDVPQWLAETSIDKLDPKKILALKNAEQRKEGIRKIGIERMREPLKVEVIDTWKDYELWTIEFEGRRIGPYLKMVNDSTGQIHVEGVGEATGNVDQKIKTCQEALAWRGGFYKFEAPAWTA